MKTNIEEILAKAAEDLRITTEELLTSLKKVDFQRWDKKVRKESTSMYCESCGAGDGEDHEVFCDNYPSTAIEGK